MKRFIKIFVALSLALSPFALWAQQEEMTKNQVDHYMQAYDRAFEQNRALMQENVESGLLLGELKLSELSSCRSMRVKKQKQVSALDPQAAGYHQKLGALDGKWDGRLEGCEEGFELMAQRIKKYKNELKDQWSAEAVLGEKIAALELQLFSSSPLELKDKCLDARRVQGMTKIFLSDEVAPGQQLSEVQLDCQSQARVVAQRFIHHQQRLMASAKQLKRRSVQRSAASLSE